MRICIPVKNPADFKKALASADLIELWCDRLEIEKIVQLIKSAKVPVVAVCRGVRERGEFRGGEEKRIQLLMHAIENGAKYVDCGIQTAPKFIKMLKKICEKNGCTLIISAHIWKWTPTFARLMSIVLRAQKLGADIVKIATFVRRWADNAVLFELTARLAQSGVRNIIVGMGPRGRISRIGCPLLGSEWAYIALDEKSRTASGQWTIDELKKLFLK